MEAGQTCRGICCWQMEKGVGYLPDFGYIRCTGDKLSNIEFGIGKEVAEMLKENRQKEENLTTINLHW